MGNLMYTLAHSLWSAMSIIKFTNMIHVVMQPLAATSSMTTAIAKVLSKSIAKSPPTFDLPYLRLFYHLYFNIFSLFILLKSHTYCFIFFLHFFKAKNLSIL